MEFARYPRCIWSLARGRIDHVPSRHVETKRCSELIHSWLAYVLLFFRTVNDPFNITQFIEDSDEQSDVVASKESAKPMHSIGAAKLLALLDPSAEGEEAVIPVLSAAHDHILKRGTSFHQTNPT